MAKKVYDEEKIRAIADKIKALVPHYSWRDFTTGEMPEAITDVFNEGKALGKTQGYSQGFVVGESEGKAKGRQEGYQDGFNRGNDYGYYRGYEEGLKNSSGVNLPELSNSGTAADLRYSKQLIDGAGNVITGIVQERSVEDITVDGASVTVPPGIYDNVSEKIIDTEPFYNEGYGAGHTIGYDEGLTDGEKKVKTEEARTEADVIGGIDDKENFALVNIPFGYYEKTIEKKVDLETYYNKAYDEGYDTGYDKGFAENTYEDGNGVRY